MSHVKRAGYAKVAGRFLSGGGMTREETNIRWFDAAGVLQAEQSWPAILSICEGMQLSQGNGQWIGRASEVVMSFSVKDEVASVRLWVDVHGAERHG